MPENYQFSGTQIMSLWTVAGACILVPIFYGIYYGFKRKLSLVALIVGVVVGALCALSPNNVGNQLVRAFWVAAEECAATYLCLRILGNYREGKTVPVSLSLGWAVFPLVADAGVMNALPMVSSVQLFNEIGLDGILSTTPESSHADFETALELLANTPVYQNVLLALKCVAAFAIIVGTSRLLWYSLKGERRAPHWGFIVIAAGLRTAAEFFAPVTANSIANMLAYYAAAAVILGVSIAAARLWDNPEIPEERLSRKKL